MFCGAAFPLCLPDIIFHVPYIGFFLTGVPEQAIIKIKVKIRRILRIGFI
jgi:hypothetical protein